MGGNLTEKLKITSRSTNREHLLPPLPYQSGRSRRKVRHINTVRHPMKPLVADPLVQEPGTLGLAHEDDGVQPAKTLRPANDLLQLIRWVMKRSDKAHISPFCPPIHESKVTITPEIVYDPLKAIARLNTQSAVEIKAATHTPAGTCQSAHKPSAPSGQSSRGIPARLNHRFGRQIIGNDMIARTTGKNIILSPGAKKPRRCVR